MLCYHRFDHTVAKCDIPTRSINQSIDFMCHRLTDTHTWTYEACMMDGSISVWVTLGLWFE